MAVLVVLGLAGGGGAYLVKYKKAMPEPAAPGHEASGHEASGHEDAGHEPSGHEASGHAKAHTAEHAAVEPSDELEQSHGGGFFGRFADAFESVQAKVDAIRRLDLENSRLKLENSQLRVRLETSQFQCGVENSKHLTEKFGANLKGDTGSRVGRTLASIDYKVPTHLLPDQLHALGVSYLKAREYEKAAVLFTMLGQLPKDETYKSPAHRVLTGLTWYRLKNWDMAEFYFDQVIQLESEEALQYQAQARLWKALIAHHKGVPAQEQFWLQELVDHHPQSPEAFWVNPRGSGARIPASESHAENRAETRAESPVKAKEEKHEEAHPHH